MRLKREDGGFTSGCQESLLVGWWLNHFGDRSIHLPFLCLNRDYAERLIRTWVDLCDASHTPHGRGLIWSIDNDEIIHLEVVLDSSPFLTTLQCIQVFLGPSFPERLV